MVRYRYMLESEGVLGAWVFSLDQPLHYFVKPQDWDIRDYLDAFAYDAYTTSLLLKLNKSYITIRDMTYLKLVSGMVMQKSLRPWLYAPIEYKFESDDGIYSTGWLRTPVLYIPVAQSLTCKFRVKMRMSYQHLESAWSNWY